MEDFLDIVWFVLSLLLIYLAGFIINRLTVQKQAATISG